MKEQIKKLLFSRLYFGVENKKTFYFPTFFAGEKSFFTPLYFHFRLLGRGADISGATIKMGTLGLPSVRESTAVSPI